MFPFSSVIVAIPMVAYLMSRRNVALPLSLLPYIWFVLWTLMSALMLDEGLLSYVVRLTQLASVAVIAVYVANARNSLPRERLLKALSAVWVYVVIGGYVGMLWPEVQITTTFGSLLPGTLTTNAYVQDLLFPGTAEIQRPWGATEPFVRPSAPFAYTNGWGASIALLTPVLIALASGRRHRHWLLALGLLLLAVPPALATTNRGLFLSLGITGGYVIVRLALRGKVVAPLLITTLGGLVTIAGGWRLLFDQLTARQEIVDTTQGRLALYEETFTRTLESPILGWGAPRQSYSSEITVGTQGMLWSVMFCFGFVGLALFAGFLITLVLKTLHPLDTRSLCLHAALVAALVMTPFYGLDRHLPYVVIIAMILLRDHNHVRHPRLLHR